MPRTANTLRLDSFGPNEQAALRAMLDLFRDNGWRDNSSAALIAVRLLADQPSGCSPSMLASALPSTFFARNNTTRTRVREALAAMH